MRPPILFSLLALALLGLVVYAGLNRPPEPDPTPAPVAILPTVTYPPGREPMVLPENYRENLIQYAQVDRSDGVTRKLYISPAALEAARAGEDLPDYTQLVIEAYDAARDVFGNVQRDDNGFLVPGALQPEIHIAEKRSTWFIEDLASSSHVGNWNFAAFYFDSGARTDEILSDCFSCHDGTDQTGFTFTTAQIRRYAETGDVQYRTCALPGRNPCNF